MLVSLPIFVSATCYYNNKEIPCDVFWKDYGGLFVFIFVGAFLIGIPWTIFVIIMALDFVKRVMKNPELVDNKWALKWALIMILTGSIGTILYYFKIYRKFKKGDTPNGYKK